MKGLLYKKASEVHRALSLDPGPPAAAGEGQSGKKNRNLLKGSQPEHFAHPNNQLNCWAARDSDPLERLSQQRWTRSQHHHPALAEGIITVALTAVWCQRRGVSFNLPQHSRPWAKPRGQQSPGPSCGGTPKPAEGDVHPVWETCPLRSPLLFLPHHLSPSPWTVLDPTNPWVSLVHPGLSCLHSQCGKSGSSWGWPTLSTSHICHRMGHTIPRGICLPVASWTVALDFDYCLFKC